MSTDAGDEDPVVFASERGGRSKGKLHTHRECVALSNVPDDELVRRPRSLFKADQEYCRICNPGGGR